MTRVRSPQITPPHRSRIVGMLILTACLATMFAQGVGAQATRASRENWHELGEVATTKSTSVDATRLSISSNGLAALVIDRARSLLGIPYQYAGSSPDTGFDCSGLVRYVFRESLGLNLPGRSEDISKQGDRPTFDALLPGDLVFFNTLNRPYSHVGIYLGNREFLHSPASGGVVRIESMALPYWNKRYQGARRLIDGEDRPGTMTGIVPEFTHGAEVLVGLAPFANPVVETTPRVPISTVNAAIVERTNPSMPSKRAKAGDPLDRFIKKLKEKQ